MPPGRVLAEVTYRDVEDVEVGNPGLVKAGGGFIGGFGARDAIEGMASAGVLNRLTVRTSRRPPGQGLAANTSWFTPR